MRRLFFEFIVKAATTDDAGRLNVIGRCGDFPIHVGDLFGEVFHYRQRKSPEESGHPPVRGQDTPVSLRVVCIHAYERSLPELSEAMTGLLTVEGEGASEIIPGWILGKPSDELVPASLVSELSFQ